MGWRNRVVWTEGMFLEPHHFQQELRYIERLVGARMAGANAHAWGFVEFEIDEGLLALGKLGLARASGVLPDGTPFAMPQLDPLPPALELGIDTKAELVCLALPLQREGTDEFSVDGNADADRAMTRYAAVQEDVRDAVNMSDEPTTIQTGRLQARLIRAKDALDAYATLSVAAVVERRADGMIVLDRSHIPAQLRLDTSKQLSSSVELLHGLLRQRAELLASRMGQLGHGVSELASFLMLQTINRNEPIFAQHAAAPVAHPRELHRDCLRLAGDLATLSTTRRQPPNFPTYRHDDLRATFTPLFDELRAMLSTTIDSNAIQIDLVDRKHGVRTAVVNDLELVRTASFVLAVNARVPAEQLRQHFPAQTKIGPIDKIKDLVNLQLPGIALRPLPVAPRQLPFHAGYYYFELDRNSDLWGQLEHNGSVAMHIAGEFPGLELEFWAIRR
jgi:type VI secretion system protein ImpJ